MKKFCLLYFILALNFCFAQDSSSRKNQWELHGYIKDLNNFTLDKDFTRMEYTQLLHNRINLKWKSQQKFSAGLEIRNRLYWGDEVKHTPGFSSLLRNENEALDLSVLWLKHQNMVLHTNIERGWLEYRKEKWNMRAGRQRINWGIADTWNPNDIFNSYNFLDYDYEERPGSDGWKYQQMLGDLSYLELAATATGVNRQLIAAGRYYTNWKGYDLQVLTGWYRNKWTAGLGWAGNLGDLGFKGEGQFFARRKDSVMGLNISAELNYITANGWYLSLAALFNHSGLNSSPASWSSVDFHISPQNLMPAKWNFLVANSKEFTPLFTGRFNLVYAPGIQLFIVYPVLSYNLLTNLDADLVWQSFFASLDQHFQAITHRGFLRLKWSF